MARAHWRTARCPFFAAAWHVHSSHGNPWDRAHLSTARFPRSAAKRQRPPSKYLRAGVPLVASRTISARGTLAAASFPRVRVTFPGGGGLFPVSVSSFRAPAPAAAQLRQTSRNDRRSPAGTARATTSRSSGGRSAQGLSGAARRAGGADRPARGPVPAAISV